MADMADDHRSVVQSDPQVEPAPELALSVVVQLGHARYGLQSGADRGPATAAGVTLAKREQGHDPVAHVLVDIAVVPQDGLADCLVVAVDQVNDVIRQMAGGEGGEITDVAEHHRQGRFVTVTPGLRAGASRVDQFGTDIVTDQPAHRDIACQPGLAGQADLDGPPSLPGDTALGSRAVPQVLVSRNHKDPAGRAPPLGVTGMVVGDAMRQRDLQDCSVGLVLANELPIRLVIRDSRHLRQSAASATPVTWSSEVQPTVCSQRQPIPNCAASQHGGGYERRMSAGLSVYSAQLGRNVESD